MSEADRPIEVPGYQLEGPPVYERRGGNIIWRARQESLGRYVAVKQVHPAASEVRKRRLHLAEEAKILGLLGHPNIVPVYDCVQDQEGNTFYSMKIIPKSSWAEGICQRSLHENIEVLLKVMDAVAFAHNQGVCHLDLKPQNVMLGEFGEVLLMDWGVSKWQESNLWHDGSRGTPEYAAPEMARGVYEEMGPHSDVYLLGAVLFEILTGTPPHDVSRATNPFLPAAHNSIRPFPDHVPLELQAIALKAMRASGAERYADARAMQDALRAYQEHNQSNSLAEDASQALVRAMETKEDDLFGQARFLFRSALDRWPGNRSAAAGLLRTIRTHAEAALERGDLTLARNLLAGHQQEQEDAARLLAKAGAGDDADFFRSVCDREEDSRRQVLQRLQAAISARDATERRVRLYRRWTQRLAAAVVAISVAAAVIISFLYHSEAVQRGMAEANEKKAQNYAKKAEDQTVVAEANAEEARLQEFVATLFRFSAEDNAEEAKANADEARQNAVLAEDNAEKAKRQAYLALIQAAAAKIEKENNVEDGSALLERCKVLSDDRMPSPWEWGRLNYLCSGPYASAALDTPVTAVAISPVARRMVTAGWEGRVKFWSLTAPEPDLLPRPELLADQRSHTEGDPYVFAAASSPDGKWVVTGDNDASPQGNQLKFWDAKTGQRLADIQPDARHDDAVICLAFSANGQMLASGSYDGTARLWQFERGKLTAQGQPLIDHWGPVRAVCIAGSAEAKDLSTVFTGGKDGKIVAWTLQDNHWSHQVIAEQRRPVNALAFLEGEGLLAAGLDDGQILLWDRRPSRSPSHARKTNDRPRVEPLAKLPGHGGPVRCLAFLPGAAGAHGSAARLPRLLSGGDDNVLHVWNVDLANGTFSGSTLRGHGKPVLACCGALLGRPVAITGSTDGSAKLWDVDRYRENKKYPARVHFEGEPAVLAGTFSSDGTQFVTGDLDRKAVLRRVADDEDNPSVFDEGHQFLVEKAILSSGRAQVITSAADDTVRIWNMRDGGQYRVLRNTGAAAALAVSESGRWIVTGSNRRDTNNGHAWAAQLWDTDALDKPVREFSSPFGEVTAVAVSRNEQYEQNEQYVLLGDANGRCRLFELASGRELWGSGSKHRYHTQAITAAAFLANGGSVLVASSDCAVIQLAVATGERLKLFRQDDHVSAMAVSRDDRFLATSSGGGQIRIWNLDDGRELARLQVDSRETSRAKVPTVSSLAFSPKTLRLAAVDPRDGKLLVWDLDEQDLSKSPRPAVSISPEGDLWSATFDGETRVLVAGGNAVQQWDLEARRELRRFGPHEGVASACIGGDHRLVATGSPDGYAKIWNVDKRQCLFELQKQGDKPGKGVNRVVFSADGKQLLTASCDGAARIWRIWDDKANGSSWKLSHEFQANNEDLNDAIFCPLGGRQYIATAGNDKVVRLWDVAGKCQVALLEGHRQSVLCLAFSAGQNCLLSGSDDCTARRWTLDPQALARAADLGSPLECENSGVLSHRQTVTSVGFSSDGLRMITGSSDGTARIWCWDDSDASAHELLVLSGHGQAVTSVAFSPVGGEEHYVLTTGLDGMAILWPSSPWPVPARKDQPLTLPRQAAGD